MTRRRLCNRAAFVVFLLLDLVWRFSAEESLPVIRKEAATSTFNESLSWKRFFAASSSQQYNKRRRNLGSANRISDECTKADISIFQGRSSPLPNGIPTYTVQIINLCVVGCPLSNIHLSCGWFASTKLVNPKLFKRVGFNDCLVNEGKAIGGGESIFFHYSNSFQYPLRVVSAACSSG